MLDQTKQQENMKKYSNTQSCTSDLISLAKSASSIVVFNFNLEPKTNAKADEKIALNW